MKKYTKEQKEEVVKLRSKKMTYKEIGDIVGIRNLTTIQKICHAAGFEIKPYARSEYEAGQRHNSFVIIKPSKAIQTSTGQHYTRWECLCDCEKIFIVTTKQIKRGQKSCGCHKLDSMYRRTLTDDQANLRYVIGHYKNGAKRRGLVWELTEEQAMFLLFGDCFYCKSEPNRIVNYLPHCKPSIVSGIDRVGNSKGYSLENCVSCCKICNRAKSNASKKEFEEWSNNFVKNFKGFL